MTLALLALLLAADPAPAAAPPATASEAPGPGQPLSAPPVSAAPATAPAGASPLAAALARVDAVWKVRDEPGKALEAEEALEQASKLAPGSYEVLWRQARQLFWRADDPELSKDEKSRLGKEGWEVGDRAAAARPDRVEGWFYAAAGVGNYALGIGVVTALFQGIEGKFKERLERAEAIDPGYDVGAISTAWGRFWYELPWPKYDAGKSEARLRQALALNPKNVRAQVYLAELFSKEGKREEARALLEAAAAQVPGAYDAPEERRWEARARVLLAAKR